MSKCDVIFCINWVSKNQTLIDCHKKVYFKKGRRRFAFPGTRRDRWLWIYGLSEDLKLHWIRNVHDYFGVIIIIKGVKFDI